MSTTRIFIVTGPAGCGKTRNAATIARLLGCAEWQDDYDPHTDGLDPNCVYLTNAPANAIADVLRADGVDATILHYCTLLHADQCGRPE